MRITCPHCGRAAKVRTSRELSPLSREAYVQCENIACCHVFRIVVSAVTTIVPSLNPNPRAFLPVTRRLPAPPDARQLALPMAGGPEAGRFMKRET